MLTSRAPAKVNLYLHVGPVQPNGRHPLDSLVVFAGSEAADLVTAEAAEDLSLIVSGPRGEELEADARNLVLRAAEALNAAGGTQHGARLNLEKHLPVAAGIGGGSADAGAALRLLTELWQVDAALVQEIAPRLGGDVPVALIGCTALMQGEGERVRPVSGLPKLPAILVNPGLDCPTGPIFRAYDEAGGGAGFQEISSLPEFADAPGLIDWLQHQRNDLQASAISNVPAIADVLETLSGLEGARLVRMSGSGATCFALFETEDVARRAETWLQQSQPDWWVRATMLGDGR
ncbi:hypothetical protein HY29_01785 [Hyphomonas beringensis]|uniref:4-diphosphocytidyl-2-C-methyl-D-erythritol kinase n=1 Tax=Hyphomonas beringensis TaxID=1280946 RepID=A0A062UB61_9PROT|nr:4-(cytidine 5'-diphospho)-2-C-methyl-D-erythritol kinase [Hyphomonas beringensis]KCZ54963.1 hypothetical protein HY29_01785 [Hyphomonas beringensis]